MGRIKRKALVKRGINHRKNASKVMDNEYRRLDFLIRWGYFAIFPFIICLYLYHSSSTQEESIQTIFSLYNQEKYTKLGKKVDGNSPNEWQVTKMFLGKYKNCQILNSKVVFTESRKKTNNYEVEGEITFEKKKVSVHFAMLSRWNRWQVTKVKFPLAFFFEVKVYSGLQDFFRIYNQNKVVVSYPFLEKFQGNQSLVVIDHVMGKRKKMTANPFFELSKKQEQNIFSCFFQLLGKYKKNRYLGRKNGSQIYEITFEKQTVSLRISSLKTFNFSSKEEDQINHPLSGFDVLNLDFILPKAHKKQCQSCLGDYNLFIARKNW